MKNFSLTQSGVIVSILGTTVVGILGKTGISETCASEIWTILTPVVIGGLMSWVGRFRAGGLDLWGFRKV